MGIHRIHITNKPCPDCGVTGMLVLANVFVLKAPGTYSIAGVQDKGVATERVVLACEYCDFRKVGHLENAVLAKDGSQFLSGHFVEDADD